MTLNLPKLIARNRAARHFASVQPATIARLARIRSTLPGASMDDALLHLIRFAERHGI